ncbi:MAG TPA: M23 family metallopeptidase, partial [Anaerovoracaceae bacterium]|nr:M23 family metallopeptidase [Anaerovoracaceae bacterium]
RYINNKLSSSRHSGLDLAAPSGTPVQAPNNGKVTLAAPGLLSTGNTIVIVDPGMHYIVSIYNTYVNPYQPLAGIID